MNNTLNNLALFSFKRKARKINKKIEVHNLMDQGFFEEFLVRKGETLILWGDENGFHTILAENDTLLVHLANFPDKYNYDEVYHFGILEERKPRLYLYRCLEQLSHQGKMLTFGLQFQIEEYLRNEEFQREQESHQPFIETGNTSWLS